MNKDIIKPAKPINKGNSASGKPPVHKRPNSDVMNTTSEEMAILSQQMEGMTDDLKSIRDNLNNVLKKDELEKFINTTVSKMISDLNENMELTIAKKVD